MSGHAYQIELCVVLWHFHDVVWFLAKRPTHNLPLNVVVICHLVYIDTPDASFNEDATQWLCRDKNVTLRRDS